MTREEEDALSDVEWQDEQIKNARLLGYELPPFPPDQIGPVREIYKIIDGYGPTFGESAERLGLK